MASVLMAWVWIGLTLAQLNNAETQRYAHGRLADQDERYDGNEQRFEAAPEKGTERSFPAPVWNFLQGSGNGPETSDFNQPQYRCSNGTLFLRFSLIRYTNLHLEDGSRLLSLPDRCDSSVQIYRWWLLVKLPYTGCYTATQTGDGNDFHPLKLHYFDRLRQENVTGMAICDHPVMLPQAASPLVTCGTTHVTVKLPHETELRKVKELEFFTNEGYSVRQQKTSSALIVDISKLPDRDSAFELVYADTAGRLCATLAACSPTLPKVGRHRIRKAPQEPDLFNLWGFDDVPVEPFNPQIQTTTQTTASSATDAASSATDAASSATDTASSATAIIQETNDEGFYEFWEFYDIPVGPFNPQTQTTQTPTDTDTTTATTEETVEDIYELWGFETIPEVPFTGIETEVPGSTASTASATTSAPATTVMETSATIPSTTAGPGTTTTTTTTTTAAPSTTTSAAPATTTTSEPTTTTTSAAPATTTATTTEPATTPTATTTAAPTTTSATTTTAIPTATSATTTTPTPATTPATTTAAAPTTTSLTTTTATPAMTPATTTTTAMTSASSSMSAGSSTTSSASSTTIGISSTTSSAASTTMGASSTTLSASSTTT